MTAKIEWYKEVLELEPNSKVFFPLARLLAEDGQTQEAIKLLEKGLDRHPEFLEARLFLIELLHTNGLQEQCNEEVGKLSKMFASYAGFWQAWAACLASEQGQADTASIIRFLAAHFVSGPLNLHDVIDRGLDSILGAKADKTAVITQARASADADAGQKAAVADFAAHSAEMLEDLDAEIGDIGASESTDEDNRAEQAITADDAEADILPEVEEKPVEMVAEPEIASEPELPVVEEAPLEPVMEATPAEEAAAMPEMESAPAEEPEPISNMDAAATVQPEPIPDLETAVAEEPEPILNMEAAAAAEPEAITDVDPGADMLPAEETHEPEIMAEAVSATVEAEAEPELPGTEAMMEAAPAAVEQAITDIDPEADMLPAEEEMAEVEPQKAQEPGEIAPDMVENPEDMIDDMLAEQEAATAEAMNMPPVEEAIAAADPDEDMLPAEEVLAAQDDLPMSGPASTNSAAEIEESLPEPKISKAVSADDVIKAEADMLAGMELPDMSEDKPEPVASETKADDFDEEPFSLRTRSMAEVLAEQGDIQGALDIYQELAAAATNEDEAEDITRRIATLKAKLNVASSSQPFKADAEAAARSKEKLIGMLEALAERVEARAEG